MTAAADGTVLDRRRVELVDPDLPKIPHHSEGQRLAIQEAVALVERVQASAERCSKQCLDDVSASLPAAISGVALRRCPALPPTIAERIQDYRASNVADWVMYRKALAGAAEARGWAVYWYDAKQVLHPALDAQLVQLRQSLGPPWGKDQKLALAAALAVSKDG